MTYMEKIRIHCKNTEQFYEVDPGTRLVDFMEKIGIKALAAHVDNQLKELSYELYMAHSIEFIDYTSSE